MVWDLAEFIGGRCGADDFQSSVELECVGIDDFTVQFLGHLEGE